MENRSFHLSGLRATILLSIFTLAGSVHALTANAEAPRLTPHIGDIESAHKAALDRNAQILIHIILEGEERNDAYRDEILTDTKLIEASKSCVVIIANNGEHKQKTIKEKVNGVTKERTVCSSYPMFKNCEGHRKIWNPLYHEYQDEDGEMGCPQTILLSPTAEIAWRHNVREVPALSEITGALKLAQKKNGQSLTADGLREVKGHVVAAKNAEQSEEWARAWTRYQEILSLIDVGKWAKLAKPGQDRAAKAIRAKLTMLEEHFKPGEVASHWRTLVALAESTKSTPFSREVMAFKKKIERDKSLKDDISAIKTEMEAESIWDEADGLLRRGDERKAMKLLRKLLGKKFNGTKTQARVRERFPDLD